MKKLFNIRSVIYALVFIVTSCSGTVFMSMMNDTEVVKTVITDGKKRVEYIDMIHISNNTFYNNVKEEVEKAKNRGYVLFYEYIDYTTVEGELALKSRKFAGFLPSEEGYAKVAKPLIDKGYVVQKNSMFLNLVNNKDFRVDVTPQQMVDKYEKLYGVIELDEEDINTPIGEAIRNILPSKKTEQVILDYRNNYLAEAINNSEYDKIIVLYGAAHRKGLIQELRKLNNNWRVVKQ
ncbi:MAG: hypothetical protein N4A72_18795 [Bacteroidales bacterium]|nr:hypothetical protein [Bacteroidales bacterium]